MSVLEANGAVRFAKVDVNSLGDNTIIAAVAGKKLRLLGVVLVAAGIVTVKIKSDSTDLTGPMDMAANGTLESHTAWGLLETSAGEALVLNLSSAAEVAGCLQYQEI